MKFSNLKYLVFLLVFLSTTIVNAGIREVSCVYETAEQEVKHTEHLHDHHSSDDKKPVKWFFWRTDTEVEVANEERGFGEKWTSTDGKTIFYQALYHDKKFLLDFQPADLTILGKKNDWETLSSLLSAKLLQQLTEIKTGTFKHYKMVKYQGNIAGVDYNIDWLPELNLPSRVEKSYQGKTVRTELKEVYPLQTSPYKRQSIEKYDDMDFADIGDNESHPVVFQLQKSSGIGYFHQH